MSCPEANERLPVQMYSRPLGDGSFFARLANAILINHWALVVGPADDPLLMLEVLPTRGESLWSPLNTLYYWEKSQGHDIKKKLSAFEPCRPNDIFTQWPTERIVRQAKSIVAQYPTYWFPYRNCQTFVEELMRMIMEPDLRRIFARNLKYWADTEVPPAEGTEREAGRERRSASPSEQVTEDEAGDWVEKMPEEYKDKVKTNEDVEIIHEGLLAAYEAEGYPTQ